jgi:hypothetical protein
MDARGRGLNGMADNRRSSDDPPLTAGADSDEDTQVTGVESKRGRSAATGTIAPGLLLLHTYRIEALLGRGGMGEVYRARHTELDSVHAIKIILPDLAKTQIIVDLFRREAANLRTIRNDVIVGYEGAFRDESGRLYLVMEYVDGPSLARLLKRRPLRPAEVRQLRDRLALGLAAAHEKKVFHRDLSPDNVILPDGDLSKAKIIDFGISKTGDPSTKTIIGDAFAGKYSYVSPEQLGMFGEVDGRSDIYSLGLVLAAAAIGEPLDMGKTPIAAIESRRKVPDLSRVPAELRAELSAMLQPDPANRPQSMADLIPPASRHALRRAVAADHAAEPPVSAPATSTAGRRRIGRYVGIPVLLIAALGGAVYGIHLWIEYQARQTAEEQERLAEERRQAEERERLEEERRQDEEQQRRKKEEQQQQGIVQPQQPPLPRIPDLASLPAEARQAFETFHCTPSGPAPTPLCAALAVLWADTRFEPGGPAAPDFSPGGADGLYKTGEGLSIAVKATSEFDGYLYVAYLVLKGDVIQFLPSVARPDNSLKKNKWLAFGPDENLQAGDPGVDLVIAISSQEPIFAEPRPQGETAQAYLAALHERLLVLEQQGEREHIVSGYAAITIESR